MQRSAINCQDCGFSQLCLPFTLNDNELTRLDDIIQRKKPMHKGDMLFEAGQAQKCLYAIRTGSFKTFTLTDQGEQQMFERRIFVVALIGVGQGLVQRFFEAG